MAGDLTIRTSLPPTQPAAAARPIQSSPQVAVAGPPSTASGVPAASTVTLDPGTGRAVIEYFDATGILTSSTPSRQQLEAYRLAALSGTGPPERA